MPPSLGPAAHDIKHVFDETLDACRGAVLDIVQMFDVHTFYRRSSRTAGAAVGQQFGRQGGASGPGEEAAMSAMVLGYAVSVPVVRASRTTGASATGALRLTRRGRFVLAVVALLLLALAAGALASRAAADGPVSAVEVTRHVVTPGETLWQLAAGVAGPGEDVRDVVLEIEQLNHMSSGGLMAGAEILLPSER